MTTRQLYYAAAKTLARVGTNNAKGKALCAMYARLVSFHCRLDGPTGHGDTTLVLFLHFRKLGDDPAVEAEARRLMANPMEAANVACDLEVQP